MSGAVQWGAFAAAVPGLAAQVQARLADARKLRLDVTAPGSASGELLSRYQVLGPPTLLLIGPDGEERRQQRITGLGPLGGRGNLVDGCVEQVDDG